MCHVDLDPNRVQTGLNSFRRGPTLTVLGSCCNVSTLFNWKLKLSRVDLTILARHRYLSDADIFSPQTWNGSFLAWLAPGPEAEAGEQACPPPPMVRTERSHGSNHANHGAILQCTDQCLPAGGQAAVQPGSQTAPCQEHLGPFPEQLDPLYWLLIKGLGCSHSEGDSL